LAVPLRPVSALLTAFHRPNERTPAVTLSGLIKTSGRRHILGGLTLGAVACLYEADARL
jgi:hypothetical protein